MFVGLDDTAVGRELHPFSITSAPGEPTLRLVVKAVGDFTTQVREVVPGSLAKADDVRAGTGDLTGWHLFLCGPPAMIDALTAQFRAHGVPGDHLHFEDFRLRGR